jgi:hypothetical protein
MQRRGRRIPVIKACGASNTIETGTAIVDRRPAELDAARSGALVAGPAVGCWTANSSVCWPIVVRAPRGARGPPP